MDAKARTEWRHPACGSASPNAERANQVKPQLRQAVKRIWGQPRPGEHQVLSAFMMNPQRSGCYII